MKSRSEAAQRYAAYKALLEADIPEDRKLHLLEAGLLQKILSFFGGKVSDKDIGGDMQKVLQSPSGKTLSRAKTAIEKEIDAVKKIDGDMKMDGSLTNQFAQLVLKSSDIDPKIAATIKPTSGKADVSGAQGSKKITPGMTIEPPKDPKAAASDNANTVAIARSTAVLQGKTPDAADKELEEKEPTAEDVVNAWYNAIAKSSGEDVNVVKKVTNFVVKNNLLKTGFERPTTRRLRLVTESIEDQIRSRDVMSRWNRLARTGIISENAGIELAQMLSKGQLKSVDDFKKKYEELIKDENSKGEIRSQYATIKSVFLDEFKDKEDEFIEITKALGKEQKKDIASKLSDNAKDALAQVVDKKIADKEPATKIIAALDAAMKKIA